MQPVVSVASFFLQKALIAKLEVELHSYDKNCKNKTLAQKRKERLAFVGISLGNIIFDENEVCISSVLLHVRKIKRVIKCLSVLSVDLKYF